MHAVQSYQKFSGQQYVDAILHCSDKKVCTNLAETMNVSHDSIYQEFRNPIKTTQCTLDLLKGLALDNLSKNGLYLIFDDTQATKFYAKKIEGVEVGFDGSLGMPAPGLKIVTALLTDKNINIPIDAASYFSKDLAQAAYKTKSEIAIAITRRVKDFCNITRVLADAHYATRQNIEFLSEQQQAYLMKIPCNRVVEINEQQGQLKHVLRLKKNCRVKSARGTFKGIDCYFYAVKIKAGTIVYFVSNDQIDPYEVVDLYSIRWNIELFHRTAKQYLGFSDCQMRSIEKQRQHILFVMVAYAIASVRKMLMKLACVEDFINHIRDVKTARGCTSVAAVEANLC